MSLKDAFAEEADRPHPCGLVARTQSLSTEDQEVLQKYLNDAETSNSAIMRALRRVGVSISREIIRQHRDQSCRCYR